MQFPGLSHDEFLAVMNDPATVVAETGRGRLPLLSRVSHMPWVNHDSLSRQLGPDSWFLSPATPLDASWTNALASNAMHVVAPVTNGSDSHLETVTGHLGDSRPVKSRQLLDANGERVADSQYLVDISMNPPDEDASSPLEVQVELVLGRDEALLIWGFYDQVLADLGESDVLAGGFDKADFISTMANPNCPKAVARVSGRPVCITLGTLDVVGCTWIDSDQALSGGHFDEAIVNLGVVTDPQMRGASYSGSTFSALIDWGARRAGTWRLLFECNQISAR